MSEVKCPKCGSTQVTAHKKGFSGGKAVAGAVLTGGIGLLAGTHGRNDIIVSCIACGNQWEPKDLAKEEKRKEFANMQAWKKEWYKAYNEKRFEEAEQIYKSKQPFPGTNNIHATYQKHKGIDRTSNIVIVIFSLIVFGILMWLFS